MIALAAKHRPALKAAVAAINALDKTAEPSVWAPQVIEIFRGQPDVWAYYDAQYWSEPNFWMARSTRNSPVYGPQLFAAILRR